MLKLVITRVDGTQDTYPVLPVTEVAFERHYKTGMRALSTDPHNEYLYWLAYDAEKRAGKIVKPFDGDRGCWLETIQDVSVERQPCRSCGKANGGDAKFCVECGTELDDSPDGPLVPIPPASSPD